MRKSVFVIIVITMIVLFSIGMIIAIYVNESEKTENSNALNIELAEKSNIKGNSVNDTITTSVSKIRVSPNCKITEKIYFKRCDHLIKKVKTIPTELVNMVEEQIKSRYPDWKIENFKSDEIIVSKEIDGYCEEHYVVKEHNGIIGIYRLNEEGKEIFSKDTEIATMYLTDEDKEKLKHGITAIGNDKLHAILEDFE